ncbi:putative Ig domain-containing protein, partial [Vibrio thalassae]
AIRSPATPIGLFAKDASGDSNITQLDSMDGIYAFAAYSTALTESDIQTLANTLTTVTLDSDSDGVWDSFDLNKHIPTTADNTLNTQEDNNLVFNENDFAFSDQDNADIRTSVTIVSLPDASRGQLLLGSSPVTTNAVIDVANIAHGELIYQPVAESNNQGEFGFSVSDGQNNSITATMTITISPVNDAPTIANITSQIQTSQDATYTLTFNADDVDMGDTLNFNVQNKPSWLTLDANNQTLSGTPTNNDVATYSNIIIEVTDSSNVTTNSNTFEIEVININDAPTISGTPTQTINQGVLYSFTPAYDDPDQRHSTET